MTFIRDTGEVGPVKKVSMEERVRRLHLAQLLHGPVHRVLAYTHSYAYTQKCDVLSYISRNDLKLHFQDDEVALLGKVRTAKLYTIPLLYKIFKFCCEDKLQDMYSRDWDATSLVGLPMTLESHIAYLHNSYCNFISGSTTGDVDALVTVILGLVKKVGEVLGVNKWKQQHDAIKQSVAEILEIVVPGQDVKERVASAARLEAELRTEAVCAAVSAAREAARASVALADEERDEVRDLPFHITSVPEKKEKSDYYELDEEEKLIPAEEILEVLHRKCSERIDGKKICCISGEHGVGKSTLASMFPADHGKENSEIKKLCEHEHVMIISGKDVERTCIEKWLSKSKSERNDLNNFIDEFWCVVEAFLPLCCAKYGVKNVGQWLTSRNILFIVDDAEEMSESKVKELVLLLGQVNFASSVLIFGSCEAINLIKYSFISYSSVQHFHLHGLSKERILDTAAKFKETVKIGKKRLQKSFKDAIKSDMNRIAHLLEYPVLFKDILSLWRAKSLEVRDATTASEFLWNVLCWKAATALEVDFRKDIKRRKKFIIWLQQTGHMCVYCVKANLKLNEASYNEIKESAQKYFPGEESEKLMDAFFKPRLVFGSSSFASLPCSTSKPQLQMFASNYIAQKLMKEPEGEPLLAILPKDDPESVLALVAGHFKRWEDQKAGDELHHDLCFDAVQEVLKVITHYDEGKFEDVEFLFKLATEFRGSHKLVQLMVNVTEYPEEWDLSFSCLKQKTLEMMMQHVAPVRIILRTDSKLQNYEHIPVLKLLSRVPISVWFESRQQFQYDSPKTMDKYVKHLLSDKTYCRVDLLSGTLSRPFMMDICDFKCTSYIVMLALRVTDEPSLSTALDLPAHLPHLLWYELKIDMNIENVVLTSLPNMKVEMFDVYLRDLDDLCVPQITGLLTKLHKRYSGIHLDNTTLSPESIYTLLKELKQRGIMLCATAQSIDKYRRWYYPLLSNLPTDKLLTDKKVKSILGFEDRKFYSDHKIQSSTFVKSIDAWNLTSYLEELKEIKYFMYKADNLSFIKTLKGEVETEHHSAIQVDTTGTIL